ncbi:DNA-deoxyinosine glycosylase [Sinanaerobacter chloroacetimidivorans]|jgi:TDG/mug DNA glycosylase family protein|uniref:DNA-deoxyinosine glycosylase n=1 Tax=Sinanaerobacter chloroacetimidivorans TaxID=2818044 RepID=A0A8J7W0X2_9FIRM|nr:DNA-deoxyinosine glycosylase [Sinanaerobacter chloroacetimidivorans]MBR0598757.1 DNA-deoxyinosine glycosylase [Sinanaerobacter chloroacetimidivorans]
MEEKGLAYHIFSPVYNQDSKILILGTMPSPASREVGFYYSHPQNRFWRLLSDLLEVDLPRTNEEKQAFLLANGIALWDVLQSCEIQGADDSSIRNGVENDISMVLNQADIKAVFTTGTKATELYRKLCYPKTKVPSRYLPSTSPANCRHYTYESLLEQYRILLQYLRK